LESEVEKRGEIERSWPKTTSRKDEKKKRRSINSLPMHSFALLSNLNVLFLTLLNILLNVSNFFVNLP
jgi:hypothetical protein